MLTDLGYPEKGKRRNHQRDWDVYKHLRNKTVKEIHKAHEGYVNNKIGSSLEEGDPKKFYSYLRMRKTENVGIPVLHNNNGYHTADKDKAEALSQQFSSVFNIDQADEELPMLTDLGYPDIPNISFTREGVEKLLSKLKPGKAAGPDELPSRVLKEVAKEISEPLTFIFQQSYDQGQLPKDWNRAIVTALYKKGSKMDPSNYRPVSLTCILCKTMEHIIFSSMAKHLEANNILMFKQHGFRPGFSCTTQLISAVHDWAKELESRGQCDIALLDFSKAFDLVSHSRLQLKLRQYGIRGHTVKWITSFLSGRTQSIVVNGQSSSVAQVTSGVPQGTVLGPLLFLIYINDIVQGLKSEIRLFADDSILYRPITSQEDHQILQNDLHKLQQWAEVWKMSFNVKKCAIMSCTRKKNPSIFNYILKNETIPRVKDHDYLGIRVSNDLNWDKHCEQVISKSSRALGMIRRNLYSCNQQVKSQAYTTLVRPKLEYATEAWSPHTAKYTKKLEAIQNSAARFCCRNYHRTQSVSELVTRLKWDTLQKRRQLADLAMFYKIENGIVRIPFPPAVAAIPVPSTRQNHLLTKLIPHATINAYKYSFFIRTIPIWNRLPAGAVTAETVDQFTKLARTAINT
jgi:hypothetical protein